MGLHVDGQARVVTLHFSLLTTSFGGSISPRRIASSSSVSSVSLEIKASASFDMGNAG